MKGDVECGEVVNVAFAAYHFYTNGESHEFEFFFIFRRDVYIPTLANQLQSKL